MSESGAASSEVPFQEEHVFAREPLGLPVNEKLAAALALVKGRFPKIPRNKTVEVRTRTGGSYSFSYAPLETIISLINPILAEEGLCFFQDCGTDAKGRLHVNTTIMHCSGQLLTLAPVPVLVSAIDDPEDVGSLPTAQELGSAFTYARRQSLTIALGLSPEDDDDGNAAVGNEARTTREEPHIEHDQDPNIVDVMNKITTMHELQDYWNSLTEAEREAHESVKDLRKQKLSKGR